MNFLVVLIERPDTIDFLGARERLMDNLIPPNLDKAISVVYINNLWQVAELVIESWTRHNSTRVFAMSVEGWSISNIRQVLVSFMFL
jgi:hypothetical protein